MDKSSPSAVSRVRRIANLVLAPAMVWAALNLAVEPAVAASAPTPQAATSAQPQPTHPGPPPEVINCVRPSNERILTSLNEGAGIRAVFTNEQKVVLTITGSPAGATCFMVWRNPSGVNPVSLAWDAKGVDVAAPIIDQIPFESAGRYCYYILFGNLEGNSAPSAQTCVDIPTSVAPEAPPTPTVANIPPAEVGAPAAGSGIQDEAQGSGFPWWVLLLTAGGAITLGIRRNRC